MDKKTETIKKEKNNLSGQNMSLKVLVLMAAFIAAGFLFKQIYMNNTSAATPVKDVDVLNSVAHIQQSRASKNGEKESHGYLAPGEQKSVAFISDKAVDLFSRREMKAADAVPAGLAADSKAVVSLLEQKNVYSGIQSGRRQPGTNIIRDSKSWGALTAAAAGITAENPWLSKIDFNRETAAVIFMGEKPTTGYSVVINRISDASGKTIIGYTENTPAKDAPVSGTVTTPYSIVVMEKSGRIIEFLKQ
jgi:uncharacterized protein YxeA